MRNRLIFGGLFTGLGILVMVVPFLILPVCDGQVLLANGSSVPMKCHWMAQAELGTGAVLAVIGLFCLVFRDPKARYGLALAALPVAGLVGALPSFLIGVCKNPQMPCHAGTYPALMILSGLIALIALQALLLYARESRASAPGGMSRGHRAR